MVKDMLDIPKPVTDASSDYSDDFDDSSPSDNDDGKVAPVEQMKLVLDDDSR